MAPKKMTGPWFWRLSVASVLLASLLKVSGQTQHSLAEATNSTASSKPNILFILTDDQDIHMDSLSYMPLLQKYIAEQGTTYTQHYCTVSLCCPSRASMWTGLAAHNTNVTNLSPPYGGYPVFVENGFNDAWVPVWLQSAGYSTYYVGKLMNSQNVNNYNAPFAKGWSGSDFLLDPFTYQYYNATFQRNQDPPVNHEGEYSTDLVANKSLGFLDEWAANNDGTPFFLTAAPTGPHSDVVIGGYWLNSTYYVEESSTQTPPVPAVRHADLFPDAIVPRTPSFNPDEPNGVAWIKDLAQQSSDNVDYNDSWYRNRLRALQAVDELVESLINKITDLGVLDNTYIFYSTDNGYHIGQHRLQPSKQCQYKEDVNIPLLVRGPGVAKNISTNLVSSHTDMAPTFLQLAGATLQDNFDGSPIAVSAADVAAAEANRTGDELVNTEMWGIIIPEGAYGQIEYTDHTYRAMRIVGNGYHFLYSVWCTNEHELYDLVNDPYETNNLYVLNQNETTVSVCENTANSSSSLSTTYSYTSDYTTFLSATPSSAGFTNGSSSGSNSTGTTSCTVTIDRLLPRLDALELVLKTCKAETCRNPWAVLHPEGNVNSLLDALNSEYDDFYEVQQNKVHFDACLAGYLLSNELPIDAVPYTLD